MKFIDPSNQLGMQHSPPILPVMIHENQGHRNGAYPGECINSFVVHCGGSSQCDDKADKVRQSGFRIELRDGRIKKAIENAFHLGEARTHV